MSTKNKTPIQLALILLVLCLVLSLGSFFALRNLSIKVDHDLVSQKKSLIQSGFQSVVDSWTSKLRSYCLWPAEFNALENDEFRPWAKENLSGTLTTEQIDLIAVFDEQAKDQWFELSRDWSEQNPTDSIVPAELYKLILDNAKQTNGKFELQTFLSKWKGRLWIISLGSIQSREEGVSNGVFVMAKRLETAFFNEMSHKIGMALLFKSDLQTNQKQSGNSVFEVEYPLVDAKGKPIGRVVSTLNSVLDDWLFKYFMFGLLALVVVFSLAWFAIASLYESSHLRHLRNMHADLQTQGQKSRMLMIQDYPEEHREMALQIQNLAVNHYELDHDYTAFAETLPIAYLWIDQNAKVTGKTNPWCKVIFGANNVKNANVGELFAKVTDDLLAQKFNEQLKGLMKYQGQKLKEEVALLPKEVLLLSGRKLRFSWHPHITPFGTPDRLLLMMRSM